VPQGWIFFWSTYAVCTILSKRLLLQSKNFWSVVVSGSHGGESANADGNEGTEIEEKHHLALK